MTKTSWLESGDEAGLDNSMMKTVAENKKCRARIVILKGAEIGTNLGAEIGTVVALEDHPDSRLQIAWVEN